MHVIAAKAVAFGEALTEEFKLYTKEIINNAKTLERVFNNREIDMVSGGTDSHLILIDLRSKNLTGKEAEASLERAGLTCNKNSVPYDTKSPFITSGIRIGTPAATSRGFSRSEFETIGNLISDIIDNLSTKNKDQDQLEKQVLCEVKKLCDKFPIYK
jgi:glycine hydroxymethyltransferase